MLKEMDAVKIPVEINGENRYLLYNLNARLYLEYMTEYEKLTEKSPDEWTFDEVLHYLRAMMIDSYYEDNKKFIEERDFSKCRPTLTELGRWLDMEGMSAIIDSILKALLLASPERYDETNSNFQQAVETQRTSG